MSELGEGYLAGVGTGCWTGAVVGSSSTWRRGLCRCGPCVTRGSW